LLSVKVSHTECLNNIRIECFFNKIYVSDRLPIDKFKIRRLIFRTILLGTSVLKVFLFFFQPKKLNIDIMIQNSPKQVNEIKVQDGKEWGFSVR
jgi:hypothetical protein